MNAKEQALVLSLLDFSGGPPKYARAKRAELAELLPSNIGFLPQGKLFSIFNKEHAKEASIAYNFLIGCDDATFFKALPLLKGVLNEGIWFYALSVALLHRPKSMVLPPIWQLSPSHFFSNSHITVAKRSAKEGEPPADVAPFVTGTLRDPEFKLAWYREDIGLNDHHWQWHKAYPWAGVNGKTKDREGELFYYMHQQMLARYDSERLAVGLVRVLPFENWDVPIQEGYDSHLSDHYGTYQYSPRPAGMIYADNYTDPAEPVTVRSQNYHVNRLLDAIKTGKFIQEDGTTSQVDIVKLGAAVEASVSSPNSELYGNVHNDGHDLLSVITDPDGRHNQSMGVMGDTLTAVRDPIFFRWHKFIDNLFVQHKIRLTPYSESELNWEDVTVDGISVKSGSNTNLVKTFMEEKFVNIKYAMFHDETRHPEVPHSDVWVKVVTANHDKFEYDITVSNTSTASVKAAFRIFLAPKCDEHSKRYLLNDQLRLFIEMDKFVEELTPGKNTVTRSSVDSSVVRPASLTYDEVEAKAKGKSGKKGKECAGDRYCKCGWPSNLLIPRGTAQGMEFDLFVMATDWSKDKVDGGTDDLDRGTSYCGTKSEKYPDTRSMGFPFDRPLNKDGIANKSIDIHLYAGHFKNMATSPLTVEFDNVVRKANDPKENELKY